MAIWSSIPGETPIDDVSGLKIKGITTRSELNEFEARNINAAVFKYLSRRPSRRSARFDYPWCLNLHCEMFGKVWRWAGQIRTQNQNLGVPFYLVPEQLGGLLLDLECWRQSGMDYIEQSARLHHRAVQIHPFLNGNGRWARMLANIWLKRHGLGVIQWPEQTIGEQSMIRDAYLTAIKLADKLDYARLVALHHQFHVT